MHITIIAGIQGPRNNTDVLVLDPARKAAHGAVLPIAMFSMAIQGETQAMKLPQSF
jgi:hypothetical protein